MMREKKKKEREKEIVVAGSGTAAVRAQKEEPKQIQKQYMEINWDEAELPPDEERKRDNKQRVYYVNHREKTTYWYHPQDPRREKEKKHKEREREKEKSGGREKEGQRERERERGRSSSSAQRKSSTIPVPSRPIEPSTGKRPSNRSERPLSATQPLAINLSLGSPGEERERGRGREREKISAVGSKTMPRMSAWDDKDK
eukprot:CAMPEP_0182421494 /NCGR_PEP_ID=MMETSP1167-20130531/6927_1 /TAXON_ID=2988 /ORGANISM="Mallomonas Sp, Strain CCMP3275" /LENGTH=199 /DNA_ID=CAMNT_0024598717 /DNA_START=70 /DNA_END=670 /DNA_ORIENTATION=-